jgi:hypothetical protein
MTDTITTNVTTTGLIGAVIAALGLVGAGYMVKQGLEQAQTGNRSVTVRGVAEREVKADLVLWPIRFTVAGNDLGTVMAQVDTNIGLVRNFLTVAGFKSDDIQVQKLEVTDVLAQQYPPQNYTSRYIINQTISLRTTDVERVQTASRQMSGLVKQGVLLQDWRGPIYIFTKLNDIKPAMIAEATASARKGAEQFANDSHSGLGGIKEATQGYFEIQPRDETGDTDEKSQINKRVRVVTSVSYLLK